MTKTQQQKDFDYKVEILKGNAKKVQSGFFDNDITEFYDGGMSTSEISDYIQMMS